MHRAIKEPYHHKGAARRSPWQQPLEVSICPTHLRPLPGGPRPPVTVTSPLRLTSTVCSAQALVRKLASSSQASPRAQSYPRCCGMSDWPPEPAQVARRLTQYELQLLRRARLTVKVIARTVGSSEDDLCQPRNGKQHPSVGSLWNHQRMVAGQKFPIHHHVMHWLGATMERTGRCGLAVLLAQGIDPHPVALTTAGGS